MNDNERQRYARHLLLPGVGEEVYERVLQARVLVVGAGGLGSPVLLYLAGAGVGTLGIIDSDVVELSNLQRQVLYDTDDLGKSKAQRAAARLEAMNPDVRAVAHVERFDESIAADLVSGYDIVVSAADNTMARYAANDECVRQGKTLVEAAVHRFSGQAMTIRGGQTACYRCLFPVPPEGGCAPYVHDKGILGPVAGMLGAIQAAEVIKVITGVGEPLYDRMVCIDLSSFTFATTPIERDPGCASCGASAT